LSLPERVAIASRNPGKIREILAICSGWGVSWRTAEDDPAGWPDVEETGTTYLDNAVLKARAVAAFTGLPAIADDSGIEVDALDGKPGVRSARFAGNGATDETNLSKLIESIRGVPELGRTARYRCVAALVDPAGDVVWAEATCEGTLRTDPVGDGGFGYDPVFVPVGETRTMAELDPDEKDAISHRGKAFRELGERLGSPR
jgi:XTP/dITP diphosphohydrolase